ncbi:MAG: DUF748 domain-containing protein [Verrucomicrobia bacterium]|nr:DUF748 domain-containing protein [Verrucomicrobiota bacterium]
MRLAHYQPYLEGATTAQLTNGVADLQFDYWFSAGTNGTDLVVSNANGQIAHVQVLDPATGETVAGLQGFHVRQATFDLRAAQPYLDPALALNIASGALTLAGKLRFQTNDTAGPQLTFAGTLRATNVVTADQAASKEIARWDDLTVSGIEAALLPNQFTIDEIRFVRPKINLLIHPDGRPNLSHIHKRQEPAAEGAVAAVSTNRPASSATSEVPPVQLGALVLDQASFTFADDSVKPRVALGIDQMDATVKGLASTLTNLAEGAPDKLDKLAAALAKRPALNLEIEGMIDPKADRDVLARHRLRQQLKAKRLQELAAKKRAPASADTFQVEPEESKRLLRAAFVETFGTNIALIIRTNQARLAATRPPADATAAPPRQGLLQRVTTLFGGGSHRSKAEKRLGKTDREALSQATPEFMEQLLAEHIAVPEEELRELMTARARWVRDWLVKTGQIVQDRLFLVTAKPPDTGSPGASRVSLSLN